MIEESASVEADAIADPSASATAVGLVCSRRAILEDGWQLEWDVRFPAEQTRVIHIERRASRGSTLVWREMRPGSGRTITAEWSEASEVLTVREWGGRQRLEDELTVPAGGILPLHLLEQVRTGALERGTLSAFDPLSRSFDQFRLESTGEPLSMRRVDLVREDGTLAGAWCFDSEGLVSFQWQGGNLRGRRIAADEYQRRLESVSESEVPTR